jgi:hypothetical protein
MPYGTNIGGFRVWGFAIRASDFALRATTGQDDPTSRGSRLKEKSNWRFKDKKKKLSRIRLFLI